MFPTIEIESRFIPKNNFTIKTAQVFLDLSVLAGAFTLAYLLRFDFDLPDQQITNFFVQMSFVVPFQFVVMRFCGVHRFIWRYIGVTETNRIVRSLALASLPLLLVRWLFAGNPAFPVVPQSIIVLDFFLSAVGTLGIRLLRREIYENMRLAKNLENAATSERKSVLLIGAGRAGVMTLNELKTGYRLNYDVKGFIDDNPLRQNSIIGGVKVLGTTEDIPRLVRGLSIDHVIITIAQLSSRDMRRIVEICETAKIKIKTIPALSDLLEEKVIVSRIRDVEVEDLLGRLPVELDRQSINEFLAEKTVLITGAGGSIGSEIVRQLLNCRPRKLILVERSEFALFNIENEIRQMSPDCEISAVIADIGDADRLTQDFCEHRPQIVFHAAAHKHVPLMEVNCVEALKNNTLGTNLVGLAAAQHDAEAFVLISTDKAVNPTSVMGASKRIAELVVQDLNRRFSTKFVAVRFGNVMNSTGSVIPIFRDQIRRGGPVTVTHPEMQRFFMTIPEASQLVLQAGAIGKGGEIFILDMGEPVKIYDLARDMIRLSGLELDQDIEIICTGIRPGEKLFEELETGGEKLVKTVHPKIFNGQIAAYPSYKVVRALNEIENLCRFSNDQKIRSFINDFLPEARLSGTNSAQLLPPIDENPASLASSGVAEHWETAAA
jgi:FlaA1/EpsC-like NDP-sugar epimerase